MYDATYKLNVHSHMLISLFDQVITKNSKDLTNILKKHFNRISSETPHIRYNNLVYYQEEFPEWQPKLELLPEFHVEMDSVLAAKAILDTQQTIIAAFLRRLLNTVDTPADIYALVPKEHTSSLGITEYELYLSASPPSDEQITTFRNENAFAFETLKELRITKLLLKG